MSFNLDKELLLRIQANIEYIKEIVHANQINNIQKLSEMNESLIKQEANLREHIRRTEINEQKLEKFENDIKPVLDSVRSIKILFMVLSGLMSIAMIYLKLR